MSQERGGAAPPTAAAAHATALLASLGHDLRVQQEDDATARWARSGAMHLTGEPGGPPLVSSGPAVALRGALLALAALAPGTDLPDERLLGERAALLELSRGGAVSCGGATRLLPARDGTVVVSLARDDDAALVPALVQADAVDGDGWPQLTAWVAERPAGDVRERARLLGLPVAVVGETPRTALPWVLSAHGGGTRTARRPLVVDLTSLWAGPLCASLLRALGCDVVKVEDPARPDGARRGSAPFFDLLHAGSTCEAVDLHSARGRARLHALVEQADVVLESSRPRALAQLGLAAEDVVAAARRLTWVSITAHGRDQPDRLGYGDDAAAAAGLVAEGEHGPVFVGDAVADPLTGVHAALAAWAGVLAGDARLVDLPLSRVAATAAALAPEPAPRAEQVSGRWCVPTSEGLVEVALPAARRPRGTAPAL